MNLPAANNKCFVLPNGQEMKPLLYETPVGVLGAADELTVLYYMELSILKSVLML